MHRHIAERGNAVRTILVTGGAGYIGSAVAVALAHRGHKVIIYDDLELGHREAVAGFELIKGRVGDRAMMAHVLQSWRFDAAVHLAARSQVGESVANPGKYFQDNVAEGIEFFTTLHEHGVKRVVFSSTAAVYGNPEIVPIPEEHSIRPINPYGETKAMLERVLNWYDQAYGLRSIALRYFNAAGAIDGGGVGEDHRPETHLIPLMMQVALGQRPVLEVFGTDYPTPDGTAIRDYIHVDDLANAHVLALEALFVGATSMTLNLGSGTGYSVKEVLSAGEQVLGRKLPVVYGPRRAGDPPVLVADPGKARRVLGWTTAKSGVQSILRSGWEWHSRHPFGYGDGAHRS
jgi:UDP-glucose 4-epimerase